MPTWFTIVKILVIFMKSFSVLSRGAYTRHANAVMGFTMKSHFSEMRQTETVIFQRNENQTDSIIADNSISQTVVCRAHNLPTLCSWSGDSVLNVALKLHLSYVCIFSQCSYCDLCNVFKISPTQILKKVRNEMFREKIK
jgi:hypothetical protein